MLLTLLLLRILTLIHFGIQHAESQNELELRSLRVAELEAIINRKDSMVTALKQKISKALIGLEGDGLTIEQRNGKVYISLVKYKPSHFFVQ